MENRVLVAIDLSENSLKAVDYVGRMLQCHPSLLITLLHVIREPSPDIMPDPEERKRVVQDIRSKTLALMEKAGRRITAHDIPAKCLCLRVRICSKPVSIAEHILREQQEGNYQTIVLGRRGLSKREEFLFGSVSNTIVREAKNCAVWIIE